MKYISLSTLSLLMLSFSSYGQVKSDKTFFSTKYKFHTYSVVLLDTTFQVYKLGTQFDKGGTGYTILNASTLNKGYDGVYKGDGMKIIREDGAYFLMFDEKKKKIALDSLVDINNANLQLNNAYFLTSFITMSDSFYTKYPLGYYRPYIKYDLWRGLPNKDLDYLIFQKYVDTSLKIRADSISAIENKCIATMHYLLQSIDTISYTTFKDSLANLPESPLYLDYFNAILKKLSIRKPEYFVQLVKDWPDKAYHIFYASDRSRKVRRKLETIDGYIELKKRYFTGYY